MIEALLGVAASLIFAYIVVGAVGVVVLELYPWSKWSRYSYVCDDCSWYYPWLHPFAIPKFSDHCWHKEDDDIYPRCCNCGKGHPDFKPL